MTNKEIAAKAAALLSVAARQLAKASNEIDFETSPSHGDANWQRFDRALQAAETAIGLLKAARDLAWAHHASAFEVLK